MKTITLLSVIALTTISIGCSISRQEKTPPTIGGQVIPDNNIVIDFTKRYNIHWRNSDKSGVFQNAKIIGYTGDTVRDASGSYSKRYSNFGSWLVIDPIASGNVYLPQRMITFFQQASK